MATRKDSETMKFAISIPPIANAFAGIQGGDVFDMRNFNAINFVVFTGVGATGTQTLTVEACDDTTPTNTVAVPFYSRSYANSDIPGPLVSRAANGYTTVAGNNRLEVISVDVEALLASGYRYIRLKSVEGTASAVLGGVFVVLTGARSSGAIEAAVT